MLFEFIKFHLCYKYVIIKHKIESLIIIVYLLKKIIMTTGRINDELDNLIYYINEYQKSQNNLSKAINKTQIDDANYTLELNLLAIEAVFNLNHELKEIVLLNEINKKECIQGSFLSTNFINDVRNYIQNVKNYA